MKKIISVLLCLAPVILAVKEIQYGRFTDEFHPFEMCCYFSLGICFYWFWKSISKRIDGFRKKMSAAYLWGLAFILTAFFINNYIGCTQFNNYFSDYPPMSFFEYAKDNLLYDIENFQFKYLASFIIASAVFFFVPLMVSKFADTIIRIADSAEEEENEETNFLETLIEYYENGRIGKTAVIEFCRSMKGTQAEIQQLLSSIDKHNYRWLYDCLFEKFSDKVPEDILEIYKEHYKTSKHDF